ncbi:MAG: CopG family antitoxin [candidate division SR1 bacterium]|nr:CopG family antitoxin [candidate division SR1 bacterium]
MTIKQMISHLSKQDQAYVLANKNLVQDILEQQLDHEEIDALLSTAHFVEAQRKKQQITMKLSQSTLEAIKVKARQEGIPYQTLIGSILHKYTTGQLSA